MPVITNLAHSTAVSPRTQHIYQKSCAMKRNNEAWPPWKAPQWALPLWQAKQPRGHHNLTPTQPGGKDVPTPVQRAQSIYSFYTLPWKTIYFHRSAQIRSQIELPRCPSSSSPAPTFVLSREHPLEGEGHRVPAAGQLQAALLPLAAHGLQRHHQVTTSVWEGT